MFGLATLVAFICGVVGIALARMTWWFWVEARPESPALATLEIMSDVAYGKADEAERVAMLDAVRMSTTNVPDARPMRSEPRKPVGRPDRLVNTSVDNASQHVIDPLLKQLGE